MKALRSIHRPTLTVSLKGLIHGLVGFSDNKEPRTFCELASSVMGGAVESLAKDPSGSIPLWIKIATLVVGLIVCLILLLTLSVLLASIVIDGPVTLVLIVLGIAVVPIGMRFLGWASPRLCPVRIRFNGDR